MGFVGHVRNRPNLYAKLRTPEAIGNVFDPDKMTPAQETQADGWDVMMINAEIDTVYCDPHDGDGEVNFVLLAVPECGVYRGKTFWGSLPFSTEIMLVKVSSIFDLRISLSPNPKELLLNRL